MARKCKDFLQHYLEYTQASEAPEQFHFWTAVSTVAAVMQRQVWIDQKSFKWFPNFYIVLVAPPGVISKSTTISQGTKLLYGMKNVHLGPDSVTWQALVQDMSTYTRQVPIDGLYHPMSCVTLHISEMGTLVNTENREMVDVMVDLWDGKQGVWRKATKTQGEDHIENPWINMACCTTPTWIAGNMNSIAMTGGFMSRCLFVYGDEKRKLVPYPALEAVPHFDRLRDDLVNDLQHIHNTLRGQFEFTREALAWGIEWYAEHYTKDHSHLQANAKTSGYIARKQTHFHKLAMILSAMKKDELIIDVEDLQEAERWVSSLEGDMPKVFQNVEQSQNIPRITQELLLRLERLGKVRKGDFYREVFDTHKLGNKDFDRIVENAAAAGVINQLRMGKDIYLIFNRPTVSSAPPREMSLQ